MDLQNIIITSKQPEYKENETLNFLLILVCYVYNFVPAMVRLLMEEVCILNSKQKERLLCIFVKITFPTLLMGSNIHLFNNKIYISHSEFYDMYTLDKSSG